jgi:hypothetical protein
MTCVTCPTFLPEALGAFVAVAMLFLVPFAVRAG